MLPPDINLPEIDYVVHKAGPVETAWIAVTLIAMVVVVFLLRTAIQNKRALQVLKQNGVRQYAADTQIIREVFRLVALIPLLAIGIRSAFLPNYVATKTWDYYFAIGCLMAVPVLMAVKGIIDWYRFNTLLRAVESQDFQTRVGDYGREGADRRTTDM